MHISRHWCECMHTKAVVPEQIIRSIRSRRQELHDPWASRYKYSDIHDAALKAIQRKFTNEVSTASQREISTMTQIVLLFLKSAIRDLKYSSLNSLHLWSTFILFLYNLPACLKFDFFKWILGETSESKLYTVNEISNKSPELWTSNP